MSILDAIPGVSLVKLCAIGIAVSAVLGFVGYEVHHQRDIGRAEVHALWDLENAKQTAIGLKQAQANAEETARRLAAQQENQRAQDKELAKARDAAARNAADADSLRNQSAAAARRWGETLGHSPSVEQCASAGTAIVVQADVLGRADRRAGDLAAFADASRAAGLKCSADYDALKPP